MFPRTQMRLALMFALSTVLASSLLAATLPPSTPIQVRITERLTSENAKPGDTFHGTLVQPIIQNGKVLFQKGTDVTGQVMLASKSGRLSSPGMLQLQLSSISGGWFRSYPLAVTPLVIKGGSHTTSNISKIGGGAAAGAVVGGVAAGGRGAAIGAGVGAGAGTVVAASTGKREAVVESEAVLTWVTQGNHPVTDRHDELEKTGYGDVREDHRRDDDHYRKHDGRDRDDDEDDDGQRDRDHRADDYGRIGPHDQVILRSCLGGNDYSNLPPGLAKKDRLPPGLEKHLQRNGTLPPGLQKRVQPLPESCTVQLPHLPREWSRVILSGRIILMDQTQRILDIFYLSDRD